MKCKKIFLYLFFALIFSNNSVFAYDLNPVNELLELEKDIASSEEVLELEEGIAPSEEVLEEDIQGSSFSSGNSSNSSSNDIEFSISENINLFSTKSTNSGYTLIGTWDSSLDHAPNTYGYGVVRLYQSRSNKNLYAIEMKSNIKGSKVSNFEKYIVTGFSWKISSNSNSTKLVDWSPTGTTIARKGGVPINVGLSAGYKDIFGIDLGSSFTLFKKNDIVTGYANGRTYTLDLSTNEKDYTTVQYLNSSLVYSTSSSARPVWNWNWNWSWKKYALS